MKKIMSVILMSIISSSVMAINTSDYVEIKELKAWEPVIDVYFVDNQNHQCSGGHKTRFLADVNNKHHVSFLLTAFTAGLKVQLAYSCNQQGYPEISGIRYRK
jgi:hypothetical protein